jgi:diguanylate cyclase (GGDEF)-like protein
MSDPGASGAEPSVPTSDRGEPEARSDHALDVLLELTRSLTENEALEQALNAVADAALQLLPGNHVSLRLLDESGTELLASARGGVGTQYDPVPFRANVGVAGWVLEHVRSACIADVVADARFVPIGQQGFEIRSLLVVPLVSAGTPIGVLSMSGPEPSLFSNRDQDLARLLANCAVPAIEKARLERLAITDSQTRAFNHGYLLPRLREEIERAGRSGTPLSVLLMDLDHFKQVNDNWGHPAGDRVLRVFADLVRDNVRRYDVFVRRGGEEFVLIMPTADQDEAQAVAERIRQQTERSEVPIEGQDPIRYTVSIGVASWNPDESAHSLDRRADHAMYQAKRAGRNQVRVDESTLD